MVDEDPGAGNGVVMAFLAFASAVARGTRTEAPDILVVASAAAQSSTKGTRSIDEREDAAVAKAASSVGLATAPAEACGGSVATPTKAGGPAVATVPSTTLVSAPQACTRLCTRTA